MELLNVRNARHSDIRRLAALVYPDVQNQMREVITCDHFLDALGDRDVALKIREQQPTDLDSALRITLQLEVWSADTARLREVARLEKGEGRRVREISNKKPDLVGDLQKKMEEKMEAKFEEYEGRIPATLSNGGF